MPMDDVDRVAQRIIDEAMVEADHQPPDEDGRRVIHLDYTPLGEDVLRAAIAKRLRPLWDALDDIEFEIDGRVDIEDGSDGPRPNPYMRIQQRIDTVRALLGEVAHD